MPEAARVVAAHGRRGRLETADGRRRPYLVKGRRLRVVCGDLVSWECPSGESRVIVTGIETRHNQLERIVPGRDQVEVLAANLELVAVVVAPLPRPDWFLADRYLCAASGMRSDAMIVATKQELAEARGADYLSGLEVYRRAGYPVVEVSARTARGLDALQAALRARTAILVGQSGVGKSSLINALVPGADLATGRLMRGTEEGRHTTAASVMHDVPGGGRLIDSPGVRDFVPAIRDEAAVQSGFPEIAARAPRCRFADCRHLREPGCAVKSSVEDGGIDARRYESYRRLLRGVAAKRQA